MALLLHFYFVYVHICVHTCMPYSTHVEIRGQIAGVSSHLPVCGYQGSNSGHPAWHQVLLPTKPSHQPPFLDLSILSFLCEHPITNIYILVLLYHLPFLCIIIKNHSLKTKVLLYFVHFFLVTLLPDFFLWLLIFHESIPKFSKCFMNIYIYYF